MSPAPPTEVDPEAVYPVREDTLLLRPFASVGGGRRLLDIGTGNGELALSAARGGARVVATDLNPAALHRLARRARAERLDLAAVRTDLGRGLGRFDRVLANPPYLPTLPAERDPDPWQDLALDGGADGLGPTRRFLAELPEHLVTGGEGYLLTSSLQDEAELERLWAEWRARMGSVEPVAERSFEGERLRVWRLTLATVPLR